MGQKIQLKPIISKMPSFYFEQAKLMEEKLLNKKVRRTMPKRYPNGFKDTTCMEKEGFILIRIEYPTIIVVRLKDDSEKRLPYYFCDGLWEEVVE